MGVLKEEIHTIQDSDNALFVQDILRLLFGKEVKDVDVDVDMVVKKRNEIVADRGKKVRAKMLHCISYHSEFYL